MKLSKRIAAFALAVSLLLTGAGCSANGTASSGSASSSEAASSAGSSMSAAKTVIRIAGLKGPTGLSMVKLMSDSKAGAASGDDRFTLVSSPDEIVAKISSGEVDVAAAPTNLAATLYNKTNGGVRLAAVTTLGVLYVLTEGGETVGKISDLKGKTVYASGQGATPEYALNYILRQNGLEPGKDVQVEYKSEHAELASLMIAGKAKIAVLPEPFVTQVLAKDSSAKIALDLTQEWKKAAGDKSVLTMGCLIVRKKFAEENKAAFDAFLDDYKASAEYANSNVEQAAKLSQDFGIMDSSVAKKAIPNCAIVYLDGAEMKEKIPDFLKVLYQENPKSVGGKLPADDFYYQK
ncbi:ABC transporter substrate-binding protein [Caproiciproducens sp. NJN-50]|uniref:ABC transporter substrate-binding protein n=1 Tax=Acutalibacteraceae TaxID=3082771 RepID=UPI000FFE09F9|nr:MULTISPECIES: MqnA/MqnD/SBP family protein [Acutalibacteraceae]QAT50033.1 ABC transporter substrate-binding protein [Caproiciproducens sp. NJN-50]